MVQNQISIKGKGKFSYRLGGWKHNAGVRLLLFFVLAVLFYFSLADKLVPKTYDIRVGTTSEKPILAPKQLENSMETQKSRDAAAKKVQPVYSIVSTKNEGLVENIFDRLAQINSDSELNSTNKVLIYRNEFPSLFQDYSEQLFKNLKSSGQHNESLLNEMKKQIEEQRYRIPEEAFFKFARLTKEDLASMKPVAVDIMQRLMSDPIIDASAARAKVAELVNTSPITKNTSRELVQEVARFVVTPNKFFDQAATDEARAIARENTPPVYTKKNEILVDKGQLITDEIFKRLDGWELLKTNSNYWPQIGLLIMVALFVFALYMFISRGELAIKTNNVQLLMLVLIFLLNITGMKIVALGQNLDYPFIGYLAPIAMGIMLIAILLDAPLAVMSSFIFSIMASIVFNGESEQLFDFRYGFVAAVISIASIFAIQRASQRLAVLKAGIMVSLFASLSVGSLLLLQYSTNELVLKEILLSLSFAVASGILTAVLVIGLLPFFETVFGILSPLKLVELSNPNHPLLRKLLIETPGTYHHSVMVGNLSEAAAEAIRANGLLCRVGAFYHDVGKTKRPSYFIENQVNIENPHDHIDPNLSKSIIIAHARDGVEMLKEYKLPKQFCDIAEQHHGTTLLKYFYVKALKQQGEGAEKQITEEEYRYPGPKAQTKETAIVGIADCVEAAVRSLRNPTIEQIDTMVRKIIKDRLDDGQFNECDLTLRELDIIAKTLKETLLGIFHSRIEYPAEMPAKSENKGA